MRYGESGILGQVLAPLVRGGHKHLGCVTPAMFCREELGISATAAWDSVRLAEGLLRRPILRQAYLEEGLPRTHARELLRLDAEGDAAWAARAAGLSVQELRRALKPPCSSMAGEEKENARVRTYDLEAEPYATWLAAVELARRREGRDLGPVSVLEQILAEFAAARGASHGGTMRVERADPGTRIWEIGLQEGEAWRVWCDDRLVDGEALDREGSDDRVCEAVAKPLLRATFRRLRWLIESRGSQPAAYGSDLAMRKPQP